MNPLFSQIRAELQNPDFPNLKFLYSPEVLSVAGELLEVLLEEEKQEFYAKLSIDNSEISFQTFQDFSLVDYFFSLLDHFQGVHNDEVIRKIIEDFEPKYIDFGNEVAYNQRLYEMYVYCSEHCTLNVEERRIIDKTLKSYKVRGISLPEEKKARLKEISKELSELSQKFGNNLLDDKKEFEYILQTDSAIQEMPEDDKQAARERAGKKEQDGYLFDASASAYSAIMKYCSDAKVREKFYRSRVAFASAGKYDNRSIVLDILRLREEKSHILGYDNYAQLALEFKMAESPEQVSELFQDIALRARPKAEEELEEIRSYFHLDSLRAWDVSYYARKLREEKYALDDAELKKYFVYENVLSALFETVQRLYGLELKAIETPSYDSDVQVYEVYRAGKFLSYFFTDYFYNPLKHGGAWANLLREKFSGSQEGNSYKKIVLNVCNFQKSSSGVTLLTLDEVETMYHEFGHAIHEMLSYSSYGELSGFHVERDFVELPSQLLENWARDELGMNLFARHYETQKPLPSEMFNAMKLLETFGNGHFVLRQNELAMLDMSLHTLPAPKDISELQNLSDELYKKNSLFPLLEDYVMYAGFSHIFDGGYSAGYYSYMWAEIIEKEVWKVFKDSGDIFHPEVAQKFYTTILGAGTTQDGSDLFRNFMGRNPNIDAFLQEKGLI